MSEPTPEKIKCAECGDSITGVIPKWKNGKPLCRNCTFRFDSKDKVSQNGSQEVENGRGRQALKSKSGKVYWRAALVFSIIVFMATLPRLTSSFVGGKPVRVGTMKTDSKGDECINNLWKISKITQDTGSPDVTLTCPASGKPYIVIKTENDTVILCPSPELHKIKSASVSRNNPFPEVVQ